MQVSIHICSGKQDDISRPAALLQALHTSSVSRYRCSEDAAVRTIMGEPCPFSTENCRCVACERNCTGLLSKVTYVTCAHSEAAHMQVRREMTSIPLLCVVLPTYTRVFFLEDHRPTWYIVMRRPVFTSPAFLGT